MLMLAISGYFFVKNLSHKKLIAEQTIEIKEQHIQDLEKERQLVATKSVLKGEESERSRMARDLHDGLGGLLSGVKINLSSMKGNSIITSENAQAFDHAIKLLDTSISELRRVAHNLMPETLNHYGLKTALNDFVGEMSKNPATELTFNFFGADIRFESQLELTAYRIAQELVNNALKHSGAKKIDLQLIADLDRICIQVVDNGKGFDANSKSGDGKGLVSIRDRVTANNGRIEIESVPGQGTEVTVEFLLS
jgi:two-component system NarL family sensor kinase